MRPTREDGAMNKKVEPRIWGEEGVREKGHMHEEKQNPESLRLVRERGRRLVENARERGAGSGGRRRGTPGM